MNKMKYLIAPVMLGVMLFSFSGSSLITNDQANQVPDLNVEEVVPGPVTLDEFLNICCDEEDEAEPESKSADNTQKLKKKKKSKKSKKKSKKKAKSKSSGTKVWIPRTGKKYHSSSKCSKATITIHHTSRITI